MSGRTKNICYRIACVFICAAALAFTGYLVYDVIALIVTLAPSGQIAYGVVLGAAALCAVFFPLPLVLHEVGHWTLGSLAGMRFLSVQIGCFFFSEGKMRICFRNNAKGEVRCAPRRPTAVRTKYFIAASGGIVFDVLYAAVFISLFFLLPQTPALCFFVLFAPAACAEGLCALLPAELAAGRTDGAVLAGLLMCEPETECTVRVLTAQAILRGGSFADVPYDLLFHAPVMREDRPVYAALLRLQIGYCEAHGLTDEAEKLRVRLDEAEKSV